jgi:predicted ester cyclase
MGIPPTGERVTITGIEFDRVVDGNIEEIRVIYDALGMMRQLGVVPQPEQAR